MKVPKEALKCFLNGWRRDREGCLAKTVKQAKEAMRCSLFFMMHDRKG